MSNVDTWIKLKYIVEQIFGKDVIVLKRDTPMSEDKVNYPEIFLEYDWYIEIKYGDFGYVDSERVDELVNTLNKNGFEVIKWTLTGECEYNKEVFYLEVYISKKKNAKRRNKNGK